MPSIESCWRWPGRHRKEDSRAIVQRQYAYRLIYEAATGSPPVGSLHHTCHHAWCVNPWHLSPLPQSDHARLHGHGGDWGQADKTHCPQGHPYNEANTYTYTRKDGRIERHCRPCTQAAKKRYRAKRF